MVSISKWTFSHHVCDAKFLPKEEMGRLFRTRLARYEAILCAHQKFMIYSWFASLTPLSRMTVIRKFLGNFGETEILSALLCAYLGHAVAVWWERQTTLSVAVHFYRKRTVVRGRVIFLQVFVYPRGKMLCVFSCVRVLSGQVLSEG